MSLQIYEQHKASFRNVSAYAVLHDGEHVANINIKYPADGAGRLYAYVQWLGLPMVRAHASGGGYDKRSAACAKAACKLTRGAKNEDGKDFSFLSFRRALEKDAGGSFESELRAVGFTVLAVL